MDGLNRIHTALLANTDNPCFKIETDAITDLNILEVVLALKRNSRAVQVSDLKMSVTNAQNYKLLYEDLYGKILITKG
jgi:hypothetical protein